MLITKTKNSCSVPIFLVSFRIEIFSYTSAHGARIMSSWVYEGFNASGGLQPSVYTGLNAFAEKLVCTRTNEIRDSNPF